MCLQFFNFILFSFYNRAGKRKQLIDRLQGKEELRCQLVISVLLMKILKDGKHSDFDWELS